MRNKAHFLLCTFGEVERKVDNKIGVILEAWGRAFGHNPEKVLKLLWRMHAG